MIVGFPPFHSPNKKNLDKRIMSGVIRFPKDMNADAQDLIEWLLAINPADRPEEFSDIKKHRYFNSIHWGRIAKKQAIPPWIPDLYKWHAPKRFTNIPLNQVFLRLNKGKEMNSASHNPVPKPNAQFNASIYAFDQKSNMVHHNKIGQQENQKVDELYLEGKHQRNFSLNSPN